METPKTADCPKFLDNLERLVDGCMTKEEEKEFLTSIRPNIECIEKLEIEKAYKEFLAKKLERKCCSQALIKDIQDCIKDDN